MRLKSTAVWYDLPGVEAAYMPIGAPSAVDALMNVGRTDALGNHRMAGRYTATPGVLPTWSAATGWAFNGTTQYLDTGVIPQTPSCSGLVGYSGFTGGPANTLFGAYGSSNFLVQSSGSNMRSFNGGFIDNAPVLSAGVYGISGKIAYRNGLPETNTMPSSAFGGDRSIMLGALNLFGTAGQFASLRLKTFLFASRILTPAEMWLASRQMAYCEQNPDWNAWARRRRYYYAPLAAAAIRWPGVGRGGPVGGSPGIRGSTQ